MKVSEKTKGTAIGGLLGAAAGHGLSSKVPKKYQAATIIGGGIAGALGGRKLFGMENTGVKPPPNIQRFRRHSRAYEAYIKDQGLSHDHRLAVDARRQLGLNKDYKKHQKHRSEVEFLFKSASFELGAREVMHKIARLPDFLDKPRRGEKLEPGSKDFDKNQAFGRGVGAAAATSLLTSPAAFMLARKGKGKAAAAVAASPLATGTATALANYRKRRKGK